MTPYYQGLFVGTFSTILIIIIVTLLMIKKYNVKNKTSGSNSYTKNSKRVVDIELSVFGDMVFKVVERIGLLFLF